RRVDPSGELFEMVGDSQSKRPTRRTQSWVRHTRDGLYTARNWLLTNAAPGVPPWMIGSAAMSREVLTEIGGFRPEMGLSHDWELNLRIAAYGDVAYIDEPLFDYTQRPDSLTSRLLTRPEAREAEMADISAAWMAVLRAHEHRRPVSRAERAAIFDAVARAFLQRALLQRRMALGGRRWAAFKDVVRACWYSPRTALLSWRFGIVVAAVLAPRWLVARATTVGHRCG